MMEKTGTSELIIESVGCGPFQVVLFILTGVLSLACAGFTNQFMSFGNYNPGWRCLDTYNSTLHGDNLTSINGGDIGKTGFGGEDHSMSFTINETTKNNATPGEYTIGDCTAFESCKNVEFNPDSSTLVTEWSLLCGRAWVTPFIISLQMAGLLIGACLSGLTSDAFGRKWVLICCQAFTMIFNVITIYSTSWEMFAALRLLLGISVSFQATLYYIYIAEFVTIKWRAIILGLPAYPFIVVLFGITCFLLRDWRDIHIATSAIAVIGLVPAIWLPESLRWLEVKKKTVEFQRTAQKIARYNGKSLPPMEQLNFEKKVETKQEKHFKEFVYNTFHLFRKDYRKYTILITVPWFLINILYYAIAFGVKALSGDFYLNLIMFYGIEIVIDGILMFAPNVFGRKKAGVAFTVLSGVCLLLAGCFHEFLSGNVKVYGVAALAMFGRISISAFWPIMQLFMVEIYPTVIRGAANSWGLAMARIGGIVAPILIPTDTSKVFICYSIMGVLAFICTICVMFLPETKGKALKATFKDNSVVSNESVDI